MTTFVRLVPGDKNRLKQVALSPTVLDAVWQKVTTPVTAAMVDTLLDHLFQHNELWHEDTLALYPFASGAFFAIKKAFQEEKLVAYAIPEASLEEEHIINMLKKRGYWPWY